MTNQWSLSELQLAVHTQLSERRHIVWRCLTTLLMYVKMLFQPLLQYFGSVLPQNCWVCLFLNYVTMSKFFRDPNTHKMELNSIRFN